MAKKKWSEDPVVEKLVQWLVYGVIVSLVPFLFGFFQAADRNERFTFSLILGAGQLLLVCVAIAAPALGELVPVEVLPERRIMKTFAIGSCTLVVIVASLWFGDISATIQGKSPADPRTVSLGSSIVYVWALASSAWCLLLAEEKRVSITAGARKPTPPASLPDMQQDEEE
jgi:hypothetical protein